MVCPFLKKAALKVGGVTMTVTGGDAALGLVLSSSTIFLLYWRTVQDTRHCIRTHSNGLHACRGRSGRAVCLGRAQTGGRICWDEFGKRR
jgi:hypothetical protein